MTQCNCLPGDGITHFPGGTVGYIRKEEEVRRIEEEACEVRVARYAKIVYWFLYICRFIYNKVLIVVLVVLILVLILSAIYNNFF